MRATQSSSALKFECKELLEKKISLRFKKERSRFEFKDISRQRRTELTFCRVSKLLSPSRNFDKIDADVDDKDNDDREMKSEFPILSEERGGGGREREERERYA